MDNRVKFGVLNDLVLNGRKYFFKGGPRKMGYGYHPDLIVPTSIGQRQGRKAVPPDGRDK